MAQAVKGINIQIGAETTAFRKGLKELSQASNGLQTELNAVNKLLKFDPENTVLLAQKQELLTKAIEETKTKIDALKKAKEKADADMANGTEINEKQYRELEREIVKAEQTLTGFATQQNKMNGIMTDAEQELFAAEAAAKQKADADEAAAKKSTELAEAVAITDKKLELEKAEFERNTLAMGDNASSQDKLKAKKESLNRQIDIQKQKIAALESELGDLTGAENKNEKAITEKRTELVKAQTELNNYSKELNDATNDTEGFRNSLDKIGDATKAFTVGVGAIATAAVGVAESTREYREDMGKLETAFETAGYSADQAKGVYEDFYAVLGESDRSVEAVNHLAKMNLSQEELNEWTTIATGVWATFGDSLPIEGLTEAANETAKVGQVVGPLADALNWAGVSEDEFNQKLAAASTEQERQALITDTLNGLYADAATKYREVNGEVLEANEAQSKLNDTMAELGGEVEPIITEVKNILADFINLIIDNKETVISGLAGIAAGLVAFNVASIVMGLVESFKAFKLAQEGATTAQALLNAVMGANPAVKIASIIFGLVTAIVVLWHTNEDFRNKVIEIWEKVKTTIGNAIDAIKGFISGIITFIKDNWSSLLLILINPFAGVIKLLYDLNPKFKKWVDNIIKSVGEWFSGMFDVGKNLVEGLWNGINDKVRWLKTQVSGVVDKIKGWFTGKDGFDTHSPSKWSQKIGDWIMQGMGNGFKFNNTAVKAAQTAVNSIKTVFSTMAEQTKKTLEETQKNIDSLTKKLSDYGSLFSTTQDDEGNTEYQINSLQGYIDKLNEYQDVVDKLKESGISDSLLAELDNMSVDDAIGYGEKLLEMDSESFAEYNNLWEEKQKTAAEVAKNIYDADLKSLSEDFNGKLDSELSVMKDTTFNVGSDSVKGLISGMLSQESAAISAARALGQSIADAFSSSSGDYDGSHRTGLYSVPFDGYRAILHKDEAVLTQPEADRYRGGESSNSTSSTVVVNPNVTVSFEGNLAALGRVLQPVIKKEETRKGVALIGGAY